MITAYEAARVLSLPVMPAIYGEVRQDLRRHLPEGARLLDVGGRRSWYTSGIEAMVTISDLPREAAIQYDLDLGMSNEVKAKTLSRRSNIERVVLDDMAATELPDHSFDAIVSVEVIEHVDDDQQFVQNLARVVVPGGPVILTTPNGDWCPEPQGDHRRHYRLADLDALLRSAFDRVEVRHSVAVTPARGIGLASLDPRRPVQLTKTMAANIRNRRESGRPEMVTQARSAHLVAVAFTKA